MRLAIKMSYVGYSISLSLFYYYLFLKFICRPYNNKVRAFWPPSLI